MSLHNPGGKSKWFNVSGQKVQGTWERDIAIKFNELGIEWIKPHTNTYVWKWNDNNKIRSYTPDFYLPQLDIYLEIKGYWWGNDKRKMQQISQNYPDRKLLIIEESEYKKIMRGELVW